MKKYVFCLLSIITILSCKKDTIDIESYYNQMKDNETKIIIRLDNNPFYETDAVFTGNLMVKKNFVGMNLFNQYGGNSMLSFQEKDWHTKKYINGFGGGDFSTLMIGKVTDPKKNRGVGYLMSDGKVEPINVSKSKLIFKVSGHSKRYPNVSQKDSSYTFEGYIISKNSQFNEYSLD